MSMKAREEILNKYHPDYMKGTKRELKVGRDKGTILYNGIVDLLEARTVIDSKDVDLSKIDYDVDLLIVGGGGAGTVAALFAYESGVPKDKILIIFFSHIGILFPPSIIPDSYSTNFTTMTIINYITG